MRRRTKVRKTLRHYFGLDAGCPHPEHRVVELDNSRWRCLECWLSWRSDSTSLDELWEAW